MQDDAYGALEHANSVTIGIRASQFNKYLEDYLEEIAHEYFHTWNLVRIHPIEYVDVSYKKQTLSKNLWFSEGLTLFYADLFLRKAGLPNYDSTRVQHVESLIRRYYNSSGSRNISAEKVSMSEYGPPAMLGNYVGSSHLQGEVIGTALDLIIRDATDGKKSMDNVVRRMMERFSAEKGFTRKDVEQLVKEISSVNVRVFFEDHVRGNKPIDLNKYLQMIGLRFDLAWTEVVDDNKQPVPDLRVHSFILPNESALRIRITDPETCWGRAGLHTGDIILSLNGSPVKDPSAFRGIIRTVKIGERLSMEVQRSSGKFTTSVLVAGYKHPVVIIKELSGRTQKQQQLFEKWALTK